MIQSFFLPASFFPFFANHFSGLISSNVPESTGNRIGNNNDSIFPSPPYANMARPVSINPMTVSDHRPKNTFNAIKHTMAIPKILCSFNGTVG